MTYQNADSDEAYRIWTKSISGNILIAEYDDGDYLIYNESRNPWDGLLLEPPQMQALIDFSDDVETSGETLLGEDFHNGKLYVWYRDGSYTIDPDGRNIAATLSEKQVGEMTSLVEKMETVKEELDELLEVQGGRSPL